MVTKDGFLNLLPSLYRLDTFLNDLFTSIANVFNKTQNLIISVKNEFNFSTMVYRIPYYENLLKIIPTSNQTLDDRRAMIRARWIAKGHNSIQLLQNVLNSWINGETEIHFIDGKLKITFNSIYGIPTNFQAVLDTLDIIKPAHLAYLIIYKYLLIEDIHEVMTLEDLETLTLDKFAGIESL